MDKLSLEAMIRPRAGAYYTIQRKLNHALHEEWLKFVPGFEPISSISTLAFGGDT